MSTKMSKPQCLEKKKEFYVLFTDKLGVPGIIEFLKVTTYCLVTLSHTTIVKMVFTYVSQTC